MLVFICFRNDCRVNEINDLVDEIDIIDLVNVNLGKIYFKQFVFECFFKYFFVKIIFIIFDKYYKKVFVWQKGIFYLRIKINEWIIVLLI